MSSRIEESRPGGSPSRTPYLQERIGQVYYAHGLFCTSYPTINLSFAIFISLICCYPLLHLPLPGNLPLQVWGSGSNGSLDAIPKGPPLCYVQQIVLKAGVLPWDSKLHLGDAFRAPLYEAFKLLDIVRNFQDNQSSKSLGHVCLHVEAVKKKQDENNFVLPQYSCLVLSPANLWNQDVQVFSQDSSLLSTVFSQQNIQKGKTSIAEMLFGMHLSDTGIKRYPLRNRQRVLQYAITLFLREYNAQFLSGLRYKLHTLYPLYQNINKTTEISNSYNESVYIYYPGEFNYNEFIPIAIAFLLLFFYYYFSVRKIEIIKSKIVMAFAVVIKVVITLGMTLGICFFFGLAFALPGKEIFPYIIILVGLENVLVLTKSVVSTPQHLDVKIRVAQGLSKEGWSITNNLLIEITILTIGLLTFVPAIQEFCIFTIVGLLTDLFLQLFFFCTILGIDTRRMEDLVHKNNPNFRHQLYQTHFYYDRNAIVNCLNKDLSRSKSHPRLASGHTDIIAGQMQTGQEKKIPKRLRLVNFWARTRFFQRAFMILMVVWIARILYSSGIVEQYFLEIMEKNSNNHNREKVQNKQNISDILLNYNSFNLHEKVSGTNNFVNFVTQRTVDYTYQKHNESDDLKKLKHSEYLPWLRLSTQHWAAILKKYNISVGGRSIAILPNIRLSYPINPEDAAVLRNPDEKYGQKLQWQALAAALDPFDSNDLDEESKATIFSHTDRPYYPNTPMEIVLTTILCFISVIVLAYTFVVLYRCICSRNYAEWRASWFNEKTEESEIPVLLEGVPIVLEGHPQEIECIATDGFAVASACFDGQIKVWDTITGELLRNINRKSYFKSKNKFPEMTINFDAENHSDYESGSPPSRDETTTYKNFPQKINTNFFGLKSKYSDARNFKYDFESEYSQMQKRNLNCVNKETNKRTQNRRRISESDSNRDFYQVSEKYSSEMFHDLVNGDTVKLNNINNLSEKCASAGKVPNAAPIWCMDYLDNIIVIGCSNGCIEFWEGTTGKFRFMYNDESNVGVTSIKIFGSHLVAARLHGTLDFLQLQSYRQGRPIDWNFTCAYRRTHARTSSTGSLSDLKETIEQNENVEEIRCTKLVVARAHQQPITCLDCEAGRVVTGSQDHTLKVFRLEDGTPLYTLHGHCGPITCLFIDKVCPAMSGSGSQDGMLCMWDLLTGACMYSIQAHDGSIMSLAYSASYVISLGLDERLCIWERFQGHLLNTIQITHAFPSHVLMLSPHLIVTSKSGSLVVWDVRNGECVRTIALGHSPFVFVKQMILLRDTVLCDFGNQLRIVRFPQITHKFD